MSPAQLGRTFNIQPRDEFESKEYINEINAENKLEMNREWRWNFWSAVYKSNGADGGECEIAGTREQKRDHVPYRWIAYQTAKSTDAFRRDASS